MGNFCFIYLAKETTCRVAWHCPTMFFLNSRLESHVHAARWKDCIWPLWSDRCTYTWILSKSMRSVSPMHVSPIVWRECRRGFSTWIQTSAIAPLGSLRQELCDSNVNSFVTTDFHTTHGKYAAIGTIKPLNQTTLNQCYSLIPIFALKIWQ